MRDNTIIKCSGVSLWRSRRLVLDNIDWQTQAGEQWFILGSNGSGKTSLIEVLLGYLWPQKGTVSVMGETYGKTYLPAVRERVGFLSSWILERVAGFQPAENIVASGRAASVGYYEDRPPELERLIDRKMEQLECRDLKGKPFRELSCGQQYRVLLARALFNDPPLLVLDEPFALLDFKTRYQMLDLLNRLIAGGLVRQVVFITHHLDEVTGSFTHGLILRDGRIFFQGKRRDALNPGMLSEGFDIPREILGAFDSARPAR